MKAKRAPARKGATRSASRTQRLYAFGDGKADGRGDMKDVLGGKGAGLAEMSRLGLPVPPGFTITTLVCKGYWDAGGKLPADLWDEVRTHRCTEFEIRTRRPRSINTDGDLVTFTPAYFTIHKAAMSVFTPQA